MRGRQSKVYAVKFEDNFTGMKANEKKLLVRFCGQNIKNFVGWNGKWWVEYCPNFRAWELL